MTKRTASSGGENTPARVDTITAVVAMLSSRCDSSLTPNRTLQNAAQRDAIGIACGRVEST